MSKSDTIKKKAMIEALIKSLGIVTTACKQVDMSRETHYRWYKEDNEYKDAVDDISDVALDFAESKLHTLIDRGDTSANIFYLKTKGKKRGYIERQEYDHSGIPPSVNINVSSPENAKKLNDFLNGESK